jgi:O-antigen/teichoic acid export membrane protein
MSPKCTPIAADSVRAAPGSLFVEPATDDTSGCALRVCSVSPEADRPSTTGSALRGGSAIAVAIGAANVSTYAFTVIAARLLGPRPYGAFAAVMNVLLVAGVLSLALQATAARRIAREPSDVHQVEDEILTVGRRSALGLGLVFLVASPLINSALRLDSLATAVLLAAAIVPVTMMGAQAGVLQGERRWLPLALLYVASGVPRLVIGAVLTWIRPDELVATGAVALGALAPVIVGAVALRQPRLHRRKEPGDEHTARALWWETVYNSQALLAFLMLSSVDIILARNTLDAHDAGLYAGGLIMAKAVLFLPQFVVVLAFPSMGTDHARRRALLGSLMSVGFIGIGVTLATSALSGLAVVFVGGAEYDGIEGSLWLFAVLGTLLSMLQLLVYSVVARQARNSILILWAGLGVLIVAGLTSDSVRELVTRVIAVDAGLFVLLLAGSLWRLRESQSRDQLPSQ